MRTPANPTKTFIYQIINTLNQFFKKVSKSQIQFQVPQPYAFPKKSQGISKTKTIQKQGKQKSEDNLQKAKQLKKAFKRYRDHMLKTQQSNPAMKNLNEKEKNKRIKQLWKNISEHQKLKWASSQRKKKQIAANKLKAKNNQAKNQAKLSKENNQNQ